MTFCFVQNARAKGELTWFDGKHPITYSVPQNCSKVLQVALGMFCDDMEQVTGLRPVVDKKPIIVITEGQGEQDGFSIVNDGKQILVKGDNARGAAYGLLELSRMAGVSPWIWWGDVAPEHRDRLTMEADFNMRQTASVQYRGIFINDEDWSLRPWATKTFEPTGKEGRIGPKTYRKIYELLLRLRANALWPAMHEGTEAFFRIPGNREMADSCGIVIGTSHCEPMLRNNVGEWDVERQGPFNYMTNRASVQQYWRERLDEVSGGEHMYTLGMRGIHDGSMEGVTTMEEKTRALQMVIDDQRQMLLSRPAFLHPGPQVFVPYKEVLQIMENGLRVPDDVTLMWCDDNYGYLTRLSDEVQQKRKGGAGVYYHLSYWGRPHDYLWLTTTQPGLIYNEMCAAYDHNARKIWIANVHDPKVAAYDLELFLDMAWNIDCVNQQSLNNHLTRWLCTQFGEGVGEIVAPVMKEYYQLCGIRRPEFMGWTQVELDKKVFERGLSPVGTVEMTSGEAMQRMADFERLSNAVSDVTAIVKPELRDAYKAAIVYPVMCASLMTHKLLGDSLTSANASEKIRSLTTIYNEQMAGGKWNGLMDAAPRQLPVFGDVRAQLAVSDTLSLPRICRNASDYDEASQRLETVEMLGHSMLALPLPQGASVSYRFDVNQAGEAALYTALIPMQPLDGGDLRYSVSIDDGDPVEYSLKEPYRSEQWKLNVLRGQTLRKLIVNLTEGSHTLTIRALDEHIVLDQWMLDFNPNRSFYELK
ncbi:MAG: glycosyl hydrolase 115 family protein [Prevotella sp.]|nr:glycosyl hydrolase 115 family protein [Prevotella sp.]